VKIKAKIKAFSMLILQQKNIRVVFEKQLIKIAFRCGENYGKAIP